MKTLTITSALPASAATSLVAGDRPNVLSILSDDHTAQAFGCYGSRLARLDPTPNLEKLEAGGMRLERVSCTDSICAPRRAGILTGQYPQTNGVIDLGGAVAPGAGSGDETDLFPLPESVAHPAQPRGAVAVGR